MGTAWAFPQLWLLALIGLKDSGLDIVITACVLGAGTEGVNSVLKYLGSRRNPAEVLAQGLGVLGVAGAGFTSAEGDAAGWQLMHLCMNPWGCVALL